MSVDQTSTYGMAYQTDDTDVRASFDEQWKTEDDTAQASDTALTACMQETCYAHPVYCPNPY